MKKKENETKMGALLNENHDFALISMRDDLHFGIFYFIRLYEWYACGIIPNTYFLFLRNKNEKLKKTE